MHAVSTSGKLDEAFLGIRCTIASSMRKWMTVAKRFQQCEMHGGKRVAVNSGDWRSGSAGPLQGQGRGFKSLIAHHETKWTVGFPTVHSHKEDYGPRPTTRTDASRETSEARGSLYSKRRERGRPNRWGERETPRLQALYFFTGFFGAQSFMPGMAPPATAHRYRLATLAYGA